MRGTLYTEKVQRLGIHTPITFEADILQKLVAKDVLEHEINVLSAANTVEDAREWIKRNTNDEENTAFVVVDKDEQLIGIVKRKDIFGNCIFNSNICRQ